nr:ribonuclease H-like domain-containing protein [Tanacetum cinerariifolium]
MKARGTLLIALLNKDQLKFHSYQDAKLLMEAIEKRYEGNKESKKVQRTLLKQQYENFAASSLETLDQTFDRLQKLISQLEIQAQAAQMKQITLLMELVLLILNLAREDQEQIDPDDLEEMDLHWEMVMLTIRARSYEHLHYVCDQKVVRPAWNNTRRVNHKNFANKMTHPHPKRRFVPQAILTKSGKLKTVGTPVNTVRPVNNVNSKPIVNYSRPISSALKRGYSQDIRPFNNYSAYKKTIFNKEVNAVKASACWGNPHQKEYKKKGVIDSGCSRHITGNKCYLTDYEDYDGGFVSFGDGKGRIHGKDKIKTRTLDFDDVYFCKELKIKKEFSVARTPQQNGVAERKNRTLIEAVRIMLVDSQLPTTFWAEAFNTTCYVLNRRLFIKPHNKTPYELIRGRPPLIDIMKPFGCPVTILNTRDYLGKFDEKTNEGFFCRVLCVVAGFQTNGIAGTKDNIDDQVTRSEFEGLLQQERQTKHINSFNSFNTISSPVNTTGPSFVNAASPSLINDAGTSASTKAFEKHPFEQKSTTEGCQFLSKRFISWKCKKQSIVANSTTEAKYVDAASCCRQIDDKQRMGDALWINLQLKLVTKISQSSGPTNLVTDETVYKEWEDRIERVATIASSLEAEQDSEAQTRFEAASKQSNDLSLSRVHILGSGEDNIKLKGIGGIFVKQFWTTAKVKKVNGQEHIQALVDKQKVIITEESIRCDLKFDDAKCTAYLPNDTIFKESARIGAKTTAWNEFSSTMASAIICLANNQKFNFSKYIFDNMVKHLEGEVKFLMFPISLQIFLDKQVEGMAKHKEIYVISSLTKKVFANMIRQGQGFSRNVTPLFETMIVNAQKEIKPKRKQRQGIEVHSPSSEIHVEESISTPSNNPLPSGEDSIQLNELMIFCTNLQQQVLDLEEAKTAQAKEIANLKKRVKKLEKRRKKKDSLGAQEDASKQERSIEDIDQDAKIALVNEAQRRMHDADMFRVKDLEGNEVIVDVREKIVKKEVSTADPFTTADEVVTVASVEDSVAPTTTKTVDVDDELTLEKTLIAIKAAKPKVQAHIPTVSSPKDKCKAKMIEPEKPLKKKDQIALDEEVERKLKAKMKAKMEEEKRIAREKDEANRAVIEERDDVYATTDADRIKMTSKEKSFDDIKKMFDKLYKRVNTFVDINTENVEKSLMKTQAKVTKGSSKRAGQELEQESAKKQKLAKQEQAKVADDDTAELKRYLEIVSEDDDDVAIEATPLSFKSPTIVDYKIYREGKNSYFKIIKADGNSQNYLTFETMFKNFNREDLEVLRSIVKERFKKTKTVDDMDNILF